MAVSPFDDGLLSGLLGDPEIAGQFATGRVLGTMIRFEAALARATADLGLISHAAADAISAALDDFQPDIASLADATARDGVVVPELVRQLRVAVGAPHDRHVHFGATSQDVIDTGLAMRLGDVSRIVDGRLNALVAAFDELDARDGAIEVMAHTRMQAALPVTAARKVASWRAPLLRSWKRLADATGEVAVLTLGGPVGTRQDFGTDGEAVAARMAATLGLSPAPASIHGERDAIAAYANALSLVTGALGKFGQDVALASQTETREIRLASGGGSSAMPHKSNPVKAEVLVALARFNATLVGGMHHAVVHENERSGAAWTLEWMILPQMAVATGAALRTALELVPEIAFQAQSD